MIAAAVGEILNSAVPGPAEDLTLLGQRLRVSVFRTQLSAENFHIAYTTLCV